MSVNPIISALSRRFAGPASRMGTLASALLVAVLASATSPAQPSPAALGLEFPVMMRQNVLAGRTQVGTRVEAKLVLATLVRGEVVPQDAILSGQVTESTAMSATEPSRLSIYVDSIHWKDKSLPVHVYLTAWYYPATTLGDRDLSDDPFSSSHTSGHRNGADIPGLQPLSGSDQNSPPGILNHRVRMKDVDSARNPDGSLALTSKRFTIKLDKRTTYVLAAGDLGASGK